MPQSLIKKIFATMTLSICALAMAGCGPTAFTKGDYDNPDNVNLLNDQFSESDMQHMVKKLVDSLVASRPIARADKPPIVMVTKLENKTDEHIDTQSIMDMVKVDLGKSGSVQFVDKEAREDVSKEYEYENSGMVAGQTAKSKGKQIGADYILNGRLDSITQEVGKDKTVYYKVTLNLTNLTTNISVWQDQDQIRKIFKKRRVSL